MPPRFMQWLMRWVRPQVRYVSAVCRLSTAEELLILTMIDTDQAPALYNRRIFLRTVITLSEVPP